MRLTRWIVVVCLGAALVLAGTAQAQTFSATGSLNIAREVPTATLLNDGTVLVAGGYDGAALANSDLYNPATGTFNITGGLTTARADYTATLLQNGLVLITGGFSGSGSSPSYLASSELYNPATGAF